MTKRLAQAHKGERVRGKPHNIHLIIPFVLWVLLLGCHVQPFTALES